MDLEQNISISVVIPAYNSADTIAAALASVAEQVVDGIEIIVVDDASTDSTANAVRERCKVEGTTRTGEDGASEKQEALPLLPYTFYGIPLRIIELKRNAGPAAARNRGIAEAKGEWIAFLDGDDEWLPGKLELQMRMAEEHPEVDLWCGEVRGKDEGGNLRPEVGGGGKGRDEGGERRNAAFQVSGFKFQVSSFTKLCLDEFVVANPVATSTVLVRKRVLEEVGGFDEQFRGPEDYDLWVRIAARQPAMQTIDHRLQTADQRSEDGGRKSEGRLRDTEADCRPQTADYRQNTQAPRHPTTQQLNNSATAICHMAKLHAPLALYRSEAGSLSMDDRKFLPQVLGVMEKAFGEGGALAELADRKKLALANQYWNASWMAFNRGSRVEAIRLLIKGWRLGNTGIFTVRSGRSGRKSESLDRPWLRLLVRYVLGRR